MKALPTPSVLTITSPLESVLAEAGGKGHGLYLLERNGMPVPRWAVLGTRVAEEFVRSAGLDGGLSDLLQGATLQTAAKTAADIERAILASLVDEWVLRAVETAYEFVGSGSVAVRSSSSEEDGTTFSFAGQHSSFLNVVGLGNVIDAVLRCWASAYSARSLAYRIARALPCRVVGMGVIIQKMVRAEKSGVLFTANPTSGREDELVISSIYGLGEGLVSGAVDADTIVLDRQSGSVKVSTTGDKRDCYVAAADQTGCVVRSVDAESRTRLSLTDEEIEHLRLMGDGVERIFQSPQDIEWALEGGQIHILQSRPITTLPRVPKREGGVTIWDNSNIIESFGGMTAPMTFSFARYVYHQVFRQYCRLLGVPRRQLSKMDGWLSNMLGYHKGRVYYNLLNWYRVLRLAPLYRVNRKILELSLGVQEELDESTATQLRVIEGYSRRAEMGLLAVTRTLGWWHFLTIEGGIHRFVADFRARHREFDAVDYTTLSPEEVFGRFRRLTRELLPRWGRTILLDQTIGLAFSVLSVLTRRWLSDAPASFLYASTRPREPLESVLPVERMAELATIVNGSPELAALIRDTEPSAVYDALERSERAEVRSFVRHVERYIAEFGYRNANELKLEEPDMRENPSVFFRVLKGALGNNRTRLSDVEKDIADEYLDGRLRGWRRIAYDLVRKKVRRCLAARERVRFCRTLAFGSVRRMMKAIDENLFRTGMLAEKGDVFYLRLEELGGWIDGVVSQNEVRALVEVRKRQEGDDVRFEAPARFVTRGLLRPGDLEGSGWRTTEGAAAIGIESVALFGTGCGPGIAEGEADVVTEPRNVGGKVLVTYRTDPGWCMVLSSASALLIERGSPLTHVAIVARELGIPTVVQIKELTKRVVTGMRLRVDGSTGIVRVCQGGVRRDD